MTDAVGKRIAPSGGVSTVARHRGRPNWGSATVVVLAAIFAVFLALPIVVLISRSILSGALAAVAGSSAILAALALSLATTSVSLVLAVAFGLPLAFVLARRSFRGKWLIEAIVDLPIVLPPAVAGLALLLVFGRRGVLAGPMQSAGLDIAFTTIAVILAQTFVSAPFFVRSARAGIAGVDRDLEDAARVDGATELRLFRDVTVPLAGAVLAGGLVMSWARALGEFGATIMFAGNVEGRTQTLPLVVYAEFQAGNLDASIAGAVILVLAALGVLLSVRLFHWGEPSTFGTSPDQLGRSRIVKISARNQLSGTVKSVSEGAVMAEVVVALDGGQEVVAAITAESVRSLGLAAGSKVVAIIKSTEVMVAVED